MFRYAEIAFNLPFEKDSLTYEIPMEMKNLEIGMRVEVPLRNKKTEGVVFEIHQSIPEYTAKPIIRQIDKTPIINSEQLNLAIWMKDFYLSSLGECIYKMIPVGRRNRPAGEFEIEVEKNLLTLNQEQKTTFEKIKNTFGQNTTHLIHGITGSGKTEVYIHLMHELLDKSDKAAIFLVPEISLTFQTLKRLEIIFGNNLAMLHSALKTSDKFRAYTQIMRGEKRIVVGTRSAIFAPVKSLGLVIIDEEHDHSYKEHSNPRYLTRQVSMQRCKTNQACLVLGSATPSLEVFFNAKKGKIALHKLTHRARSSVLPSIQIFNQTNEYNIIGSDLLFQIKQRLEKKEQVILLLNRRGHSPLIYSKKENKFIECPNCSSNLCYHTKGKALCHLCGYSIGYSQLEKKIGGELLLSGAGTQKLEEYLLENFPHAKIERLDQDATKNKEIISEVIGRLIENKIDILTGTQMIAKGLDASRVTLVGVVNANIGLGLPDFRASERVFSLLTQVSGRAGRAELKGEVIIETSNSAHPVIQMAVSQNYERFYENEIQVRQGGYFPPFCRLVRLLSRSKSEEKSLKTIEMVKDEILKFDSQIKETNTIVLGPAPCPFYKIDNNFRNHILIKTNHISVVREILKNGVKKIKLPSLAYLEIDLDPVDLV
ncbi:MAG: primosomal protein N' [Leptospiraceae bacterium]|nr:primosomal protein N' [Leptospiraceae bacterium]